MELNTNDSSSPNPNSAGYQQLLTQISGTFSQGQARAAQAVNTVLIDTYWQVGQHIVEFEQAGQQRATYGKALLEDLARDLTLRHGRGFSRSNLSYMRLFYQRYAQLQQPMTEVKAAVLAHPEFVAFNTQATSSFAAWQARNLTAMQGIKQGDHPKALIHTLAEDLLATFNPVPLVDAYDVYQHLMDYWAAVMQDDVYLLVQDGWASARTLREVVQVKNKDNKLVWPEAHDFVIHKRRYKSDLIPRTLLIARYYAAEQAALDAKQAELDAVSAQLAELEEENSAEDMTFAGLKRSTTKK